MEDICVMLDGYLFNYRAGAIIKKEDKILLHKNKNDDFYAVPGGRVKLGEASASALKREFMEEIGKEIKVVDFAGLIENFFEYDDKKYHELMVLFNAEFLDESLYNTKKITGLEDDGKLEFVWKNISELKELDLRPVFLKEKLLNSKEIGYILNDKL